jgi:hypothetical protein
MESAGQNNQQDLCVVASIPFLPFHWSAIISGLSSHFFEILTGGGVLPDLDQHKRFARWIS